MCAASVSVRPPMHHPGLRRSPTSPYPSLTRVDTIRQHFIQQRQNWDNHIQERCTQVWKQHQQQQHCPSSPDNKENEAAVNGPNLRLVSSQHRAISSGVTWTVTYDIRDFLHTGSVEVHCDPDGIVVTASLNAEYPVNGSLKRNKSKSQGKTLRETFLIAKVDHSSLRVQTQPNGLMKITVSSKSQEGRQ